MKKYKIIIIILSLIYILAVIGMEVFITPEDSKAFGTSSQSQNVNVRVSYLVILTTILVVLSFVTPFIVYKYSNLLEREDKFGLYFPFLIMALSLIFPPVSLTILFLKTGINESGFEEEYAKSAASLASDPLDHFVAKKNLQQEINELIGERKLRPLGNKKRLTQTDNNYNVRLFLFADRNDSEKYYDEFINYSELYPPPFCIEILHFNIYTIHSEPYGLAFPYERTDTRPEYVEWFREAILTCNEILRNYQSADHSYEMLNKYVRELYDWTILVPETFDINSSEANEIFSDPEGGGYTPLKVSDIV